MNITALLSLYLINAQPQYVASDVNWGISQTLRHVIDNYFMVYSSSFVCILSCPRQHTLNFFKDLMEILFSYWDTMKVQIIMNNVDAGPIAPGERNFNLILVDSSEAFLNIDPASKVKNYDINEYYYIFVQNWDKYLQEDVQRILDYCWRHFIINVDVLVQTAAGELIVYTYFPFTASHCGKVVPVEINRFRDGTMMNEDIFPEKLLNMHQCPLKVALWDKPPFMVVDTEKTGRSAISGFEGDLLKALADLMNFRIDYVIPPNDEQRGKFIGTNETTGAIGMLKNKEVDLSLGFFRFTIDEARILTPTDTYYQSKQVIILLKESPSYIPPEMIFYPFKPAIWALLLATFALMLAIIVRSVFWAQRMSIGVSKNIVNRICINFIAITLGMTSSMRPRSHFGRVFVTTWILSTLVIRAQYQARIFHLIRNNFFKLPPSSIDELIKKEYTFIMHRLNFDHMSKVPFFKEANIEVGQVSGLDVGATFAYMESHPEKKLASVAPNDFLLYYGAKHHKAGKFVVLGENVLIQSTCIYLPKHSFLVNRINGLVRWMSASGWISSWVSKALQSSYFRVQPETMVTTIRQDELKGVYYLCGMLLAFATIAFFLEILSVKCKPLERVFKKL